MSSLLRFTMSLVEKIFSFSYFRLSKTKNRDHLFPCPRRSPEEQKVSITVITVVETFYSEEEVKTKIKTLLLETKKHPL